MLRTIFSEVRNRLISAKLGKRSSREVEIRNLLHTQIAFSVGTFALIISFCLNPYLLVRPSGTFIPVAALVCVIWAAMSVVQNYHVLRILSISYIALLSLGFHIQLSAMGDMGHYWAATIAVEIILGTIFVFNGKLEYCLSCILVIFFIFGYRDSSYFDAVSTPLLAIALGCSVALGYFLNRATMSCIREIYNAREQFRELSNTDPLTGTRNRRAFMEIFDAAVADPDIRPLHFAMIDIDNFKRVNDEHGHDCGDAVLVALAQLADSLMPRGGLGRLGGEEFGIIFQRKSAAEAMMQMQALLDRTLELKVKGISFSFSAGLVAVEEDENAASVMRRADAALYRAKKNGKSTVVRERPARDTGRRCQPADDHYSRTRDWIETPL